MKRRKPLTDSVQLNLTPMIDVVFQLLAFFIFTLRIATAEGDFGVRMPLGTSHGSVDPNLLTPLRVRLMAGSSGELAGIRLNERTLKSMDALQQEIRAILGEDRGPGSIQESAEVELDCAYGLNYEHVIDAITAVSGYVDDNGRIVKLVEKIKLTPPREAAAAETGERSP